MTEKTFPASVDALDEANDFLDAEFEKNDVSLKQSIQMKVAMEEMFVNVAHYAYQNSEQPGTVTLNLTVDPEWIKLSLSDSGIPFDPLAKQDPDITLSAEERPIGGLGIYMVKKSMDRVAYEYKDGKNIFTMFKKR